METKTTVTERALIKRINRILAKEGEQLCKSRGEWFVKDLRTNSIVASGCEPEQLGREIGALKPHECVAEQG